MPTANTVNGPDGRRARRRNSSTGNPYGVTTMGVETPSRSSERRVNADATAIVVEVEPSTGLVEVLDAVMVVDSGVVINPAVVEGQHQGGFAQGLGNVFHEELVYSEEGKQLCSTLVDYTIPSMGESVPLRIVHRETPSEVLGGFRGAGEAAITAAPAVLAGAVEDALAPLGVRISSTRMSASAIWRASTSSRSGSTPTGAAPC